MHVGYGAILLGFCGGQRNSFPDQLKFPATPESTRSDRVAGGKAGIARSRRAGRRPTHACSRSARAHNSASRRCAAAVRSSRRTSHQPISRAVTTVATRAAKSQVNLATNAAAISNKINGMAHHLLSRRRVVGDNDENHSSSGAGSGCGSTGSGCGRHALKARSMSASLIRHVRPTFTPVNPPERDWRATQRSGSSIPAPSRPQIISVASARE
jgi:hypothetical protein